MDLFKNELLGVYKPTFFSLLINKGNILDNKNRLKEEYVDIFFHEYIHFLQDILTSYGLRNIITLIQEYSIINHEILNSKEETFDIPFMTNDKNLILSKRILKMHWGTQYLDNGNRDFEIFNISQEQPLEQDLFDIWRINVEIFYRDNFERDAFYLGAIHFIENIADLIERRFTFKDENGPYPYKVIEKIIRKTFSNNYTDADLIVFMENALDTFYPADYLFQYLEFCKTVNEEFNSETIKSFYTKYVITHTSSKYRLKRYYFLTNSIAKEGFKAMFNHERLIKLKLWSEVILSNSIKLRRNNFSFTSLLVQNSNHSAVIKQLQFLTNKLGTPVMSDGHNKIFLSSPDKNVPEDEMLFLLGLEAVINALAGKTECSLIPYCKHGQGKSDITNDLCYSTPWLRTEEKPMCLFAQLWIIWGFVRKKVNEHPSAV